MKRTATLWWLGASLLVMAFLGGPGRASADPGGHELGGPAAVVIAEWQQAEPCSAGSRSTHRGKHVSRVAAGLEIGSAIAKSPQQEAFLHFGSAGS